VLSRLNWEVLQGNHCFIPGRNGSGKITLTRILLGYQWSTRFDNLIVLGENFGKTDLSELRKKAGWVSPVLH